MCKFLKIYVLSISTRVVIFLSSGSKGLVGSSWWLIHTFCHDISVLEHRCMGNHALWNHALWSLLMEFILLCKANPFIITQWMEKMAPKCMTFHPQYFRVWPDRDEGCQSSMGWCIGSYFTDSSYLQHTHICQFVYKCLGNCKSMKTLGNISKELA